MAASEQTISASVNEVSNNAASEFLASPSPQAHLLVQQ
jgi:hypothetical protein